MRPSRLGVIVATLALATSAGGCGAPPPARARPADAATPTATKPSATAQTHLSPADIAARATRSVVLIKTPRGLGTGFIVSKGGLVVTNLHVVAGSDEALVILGDGREFDDVEVVGVDSRRDLVLLRLDAVNLPALELGDSATVRPGDRVIAIGHPLGLGNTVSDGLVSAVRELDEELTLLQISAPIAPGSSGGPLFNERGQVIGVATLYSNAGQNLNFGVPARYVASLVAGGGSGTTLRALARDHGPEPQPAIKRDIPHHDASILATCSSADLELVVSSLAAAIDAGAPLYNEGNHDACFRIYEGAALALDRQLKSCVGIKKAVVEGVRRADRLPTSTEKAWALRDAFDGVIEVVVRKRR
jgi:hypothetical protein